MHWLAHLNPYLAQAYRRAPVSVIQWATDCLEMTRPDGCVAIPEGWKPSEYVAFLRGEA